jgi:drug/metabolite transporter (DMT)-like permease
MAVSWRQRRFLDVYRLVHWPRSCLRPCPDLALGGLCGQRLPGRSGDRGCRVAAVSDPFAAVAGGRIYVRAGRWPAVSRAGRVVTGAGQSLAVLLALAGSGCFAVAAVTQQGVAARLAAGRAFDPVVLVRLGRRPAWLAGLAAVIAGFALQAAALGLGRLVVIEPVLASGLLFALVLAARRDRRPLRRAEWAAALAVVAGLAVFLAAGQPAGGQRTAGAAVLGLAAGGAVGLAGLSAMLAGRFAASRRALLLGVGGGVAAGATDALIKTVAVLTAGHLLVPFADPRLYLLIAVGLLTYTIQQNGYRAAGLAAFLPAFTVVEPVTGSLLGLIIYHERLSDGPGRIAIELAACAAATWGIARLAGSATASGAQPGTGPDSPTRPSPAVPAGQRAPARPIAASDTDET